MYCLWGAVQSPVWPISSLEVRSRHRLTGMFGKNICWHTILNVTKPSLHSRYFEFVLQWIVIFYPYFPFRKLHLVVSQKAITPSITCH